MLIGFLFAFKFLTNYFKNLKEREGDILIRRRKFQINKSSEKKEKEQKLICCNYMLLLLHSNC